MQNLFDIRRLLPFALMLTLLVGIIACSHTTQEVSDAMDRAEALMEDHPDSALAILQTVDSLSIHGRADKARMALLMSMALDKNLIDTTDFSILQPAIDYYIKHGNPDQRLKTRYYEGRIFMNRGEDEKALSSFLKAAEDTASCTDSLALARLYIAQGVMYYQQYKLPEFIECNIKVGELLALKNDVPGTLTAYSKVLNGYTILENEDKADSIYSIIRYIEKNDTAYNGITLAAKLSYVTEFGDSLRIINIFNDIKSIDSLDNDALLNIVDGYISLNNSKKAKEILNILKSRNEEIDTIKYLYMLSKFSALESDYKEAYLSYCDFTERLETENSDLILNDLLLVKDRYETEKQNIIKISKRDRLISIILGILIVIILVSVWIGYRWHTTSVKKDLIEKEKQLLKYSHDLEVKKSEKLAAEKRETEKLLADSSSKIALLERERDNLEDILKERRDLSDSVMDVIKSRIISLNSPMAAAISSNKSNYQEYNDWLDQMLANKDIFMNDTLLSYKATHPSFIDYLQRKGLTQAELEYVCLYAIGLKGKDIGNYMKLARHYHLSTDIRKKLGLETKSTNLGIYIRKLLNGQITNED